MNIRIEHTITYANGYERDYWVFIFVRENLVLERYEKQTRESKRHKWKGDFRRSYIRHDNILGMIKNPNLVPMSEGIKQIIKHKFIQIMDENTEVLMEMK